MRRRHLLVLASLATSAQAQNQELQRASPVDLVAVYVIPTDGISEELTGAIARGLTKDTGLWIRSTLWTPPGNIEPFPGTNQYPGEGYLPLGVAATRMLREVSRRTYYIVLTDRDINSKSLSFRFQYSMHSPMTNTSVLSIARLRYFNDGLPAPADVVASRIAKMLLRIVGEMRLGWKRVNDPTDLMYAPIMSIDDVDRMNLVHTVEMRKHNPLQQPGAEAPRQ